MKSKTKRNIRTILKLTGLPVLVLWLEIVMHWAMSMGFTTIWLFFALAFGACLNIIGHLWGKKLSLKATKIIACLVSLLYCCEYMARQILAAFYPFSSLKTAAGNHLETFFGMVVEAIFKNVGWILLFMAPCVLICVLVKPETKKSKLKPRGVVILSLIAAIAFHILGLASTIIPWNKVISGKELYQHSEQYEEQVSQLGTITMFRLDFKYKILGMKEKEAEIDVDPIVIEEVDTSKNIIGIDWAAVSNSTNNSAIKRLATYFSTVEGTKKNEYTGMLEGHNVIFITMEGTNYYALSEQYTPNMYKLMNEGVVLKNFYTALHFASTSGGECQNLLGLYPYNGWQGDLLTIGRTGELKTNCYFSLAQQLGRLGYNNQAFHDHYYNLYNREESHTNLGYTYHMIDGSSGTLPYRKKGSDTLITPTSESQIVNPAWPQSDAEILPASTQYYLNSDTPFNVYYITISGHAPYAYSNWLCQKYASVLDQTNYDDTTKALIATCMDTDVAIGEILDALEAAGQLENTCICITPDHIPYTIVNVLEGLAGESWTTQDDMSSPNERLITDFNVYKNVGIIWDGSIEEPIIVDKVCCQVDLLPTISNLLGLEYDSRVLAGQDILSDSEGLVIFASRCWMSDLGWYSAYTGEFHLNEGVTMSKSNIDSYVSRINTIVKNRLNITYDIVENDFYDYVYSSDKFKLGEGVPSPFTEKEFKIFGLFDRKRNILK